MAHHQQHNGGGGGIESLTPPTGQFTAITALVATAGAVWIAVKHPSVLARCLIGAAIVSAVVVVIGGVPNPSNNPLVALAMTVIGVCALRRRKSNHAQSTESTESTEESK